MARKFPRSAVKYMRRMVRAAVPPPCPACEGTGWTVDGWERRSPDADPFRGDCAVCAGTGRAP